MSTGGLAYIRRIYGVPAWRGHRVTYIPDGSPPMHGTIIGSRGPHLRVRIDGEGFTVTLHPTWRIVYHLGDRAPQRRQEAPEC